MAAQDDLGLLKQMYERGEISDEQYDVLRRHVLWGTPLPQLIDEPEPPVSSYGPPAPAPAWTPPPPPDRGRTAPPPPDRGRAAPPPPDRGRAAPPPPDRGRAAPPPPDRGRAAPPPPDRGWAPPPAEVPPADRGWSPRPTDPPQPGRQPGRRPERPADPSRAGRGWDERPAGDRRWAGPARPAGTAGPAGLAGEPGRVVPGVDEGPATQSGTPPPDWSLPPAPERPGAYPLDVSAEDEADDRPPPRRRGPKLVAAGTSMVLALALVAAGVWWFVFRDPGVAAPAYARTVCSSVRDWQQIVDSRSTALVRSIAQEDDRSAVRTAVRTYYTDLAERTEGLRTSVIDAGVAEVAGGEEYADSLATAVGNQASALRDLASRAERLDVSSATVFQISLQSLLTGAETAVSGVTAALARPEGGTPAALRQALSDEPACAPYVG